MKSFNAILFKHQQTGMSQNIAIAVPWISLTKNLTLLFRPNLALCMTHTFFVSIQLSLSNRTQGELARGRKLIVNTNKNLISLVGKLSWSKLNKNSLTSVIPKLGRHLGPPGNFNSISFKISKGLVRGTSLCRGYQEVQ